MLSYSEILLVTYVAGTRHPGQSSVDRELLETAEVQLLSQYPEVLGTRNKVTIFVRG